MTFLAFVIDHNEALAASWYLFKTHGIELSNIEVDELSVLARKYRKINPDYIYV